IRACISGAAPLPNEVRKQFEAATGGRLVEGYGLTEASPVTHCNPLNGVVKECIGIPFPDTDARIVDADDPTREMPQGESGELAIRGPQVMKGYWNKPEETAEVLRDGWLLTGDIARMDTDGYFSIVDRKKDMILCSGYNVYPREVEEVLFMHPAVAQAAAIGVPDPYRGETVKAFVVLKAGTTATADEIIAFCRERLASFKVPKQVEFTNELPISLVGKVLRRELRERELAKASAAR
ncbi:MAG TPA: AMP-binding protein, partial [Thermoplasmata archaeon]|nr:AMP-binding protein [Thermoplasmata archaeon]